MPTDPHFNSLTPAEAERLAMLAEEAGEIVQIVGKILRHGYESRHPDGGPTNRESLAGELADVAAVGFHLMHADLPEPADGIATRALRKLRYSHHQNDPEPSVPA